MAKKNKIWAILTKINTDCDIINWHAYSFDTPIQSYIENFMCDVHSDGEYFLIYEKDLKTDTRRPHNKVLNHKKYGSVPVFETPVKVIVKKTKTGKIRCVEYLIKH